MTTTVMTPDDWAYGEWHNIRIGDARLQRRAVIIGADMLRNLFESPPKMFKAPSKTKAFYRFINCAKVSHRAIINHHTQRTRWDMMLQDVVLNIQDTTTVAYAGRDDMEGLYDVGNVSGFVVHNTISVVPKEHHGFLHGLVQQSIIHRKPRVERTGADNELFCWLDGIRAAPSSKTVIDVMDRGADSLVLMHASLTQGHEFLIRAQHDRPLQGQGTTLFHHVRTLPVAGTFLHAIKARPGKRARQATLEVRFDRVQLAAAKNDHRAPGLACTIVHAYEPNPPQGEEPLEWFLLTSLAPTCFEEAATIIEYYTYRWVIEEYHKCLKTGFRLEQSQAQSLAALENLLGLISVASVQLLQLRDLARTASAAPAKEYVGDDELKLVAAFYNRSVEMTMDQFLRCVAMLGGFLNRKRDGNPGWQTLWTGWKYLMTLKEGARLYKKGCG